MAGDDCSLHHDLDALTPKQQNDHFENQVLTCALQVALVGLGKPVDHVALGEPFNQAPWADMVDHYAAMFKSMGLETIPKPHWQFHPLQRYYESVSAALPDVDLVNLYMVSGSNQPLHQSDLSLEVSRNVNSKIHFATHAPAAGIPVPHTEVFTKKAIDEGAAEALFSRFPRGLMVKLLGLAGSRNVFSAVSIQQCREALAGFGEGTQVLLQERLDTDRWQEMTVDLSITPESVEISNVRKILFAGGKWVGNFIDPELDVPRAHKSILLRVGEYAREHGHVAPEGVNCGIDYFVSGDDVIVTEINARWTGGLFPAQFLQRLRVASPAVAFFDMVSESEMESLKAFQLAHLYGSDSAFAYIPMGFTPFPMEIEGVLRYFVWQIVTGDFGAFVLTKDRALGPREFPTANSILEEALG